jgi:hypothetical protein
MCLKNTCVLLGSLAQFDAELWNEYIVALCGRWLSSLSNNVSKMAAMSNNKEDFELFRLLSLFFVFTQ